MPTPLGKAELRTVDPTPAEAKRAKEIIAQASEKELRAKMGSMAAWPKLNKDGEVEASRGQYRHHG